MAKTRRRLTTKKKYVYIYRNEVPGHHIVFDTFEKAVEYTKKAWNVEKYDGIEEEDNCYEGECTFRDPDLPWTIILKRELR